MLAECESFLEAECGGKALLTPSCTAALELACMLVIEPGDEVIMPSWTFPSCANAVILRGGVPVFVDVDDDLLMPPDLALEAIGQRTKALMPVHYAGVVRHMDAINEIAKLHGLYVIEDAAQAIGNWKVTGDLGCLSFHATKNIQCGEGGALIVNNPALLERAEIMRDCGTTKAKFRRGETDGYDWVDVGSSYLMSEFQAQYLGAQLQKLQEITAHRRKIWDIYWGNALAFGETSATSDGNGHIFWFHKEDKWNWLKQVRRLGIKASSHYEALHLTLPGRRYGVTHGPIVNATKAAEMLVKLDTSVSEDEAHLSAEAIWQPAGRIRSIR